MKQLTFIKPKTLAWWDVPEPRLQAPSEALVRPFVAARCDGDALFLRHDYERLMRIGANLHVVDRSFAHAHTDVFHGPFPYGHECVAEVVEVGDAVSDHAVGDVVIVPWAISCGGCGRCGRGQTSLCEKAPTTPAAFGFGHAMGDFGGVVSDLVRIPYADAMLVKVPSQVDPLKVASAGDNMPDAYRAVAPQLAAIPGAPVLIIGGAAKSIGLYAVAMAVALGSSRVDYIDSDEQRLRIAGQLGANPVPQKGYARWFARGWPVLPARYPIVVEASGSEAGLRYAIACLAPGGTCTALAFYVREATPVPLWNMYMKGATLHVGVSNARANVPAVLDLVARGAFDPNLLQPLVGAWDDAAQVLLEPRTKVIVQRARQLAPSVQTAE